MNIKKYLVLTLTIVIVITALAMGCAKPAPAPTPAPAPAPAPAPEKIVLKLAHHSAPGGSLDKWWWQWFAARANELAKGELEIQVYPGEQLAKGGDIFEACQSGLVEIGSVAIPYESGTLKMPTVLELPYTFVDFPTTFKVWDDLLAAGLDDYFTSRGVKPIYLAWTDAYALNTVKSVQTKEDLKGVKIRCPGGLVSQVTELLGGTPVSMPAIECYTAMQTGVVDGIMIQEHDFKAYRTYEFGKYILKDFDIARTGCINNVNLNVWNGLPNHIQGIILQAGREAQNYYASQYDTFNEEVQTLWKQEGVTVYHITEAENARWKDIVLKPVWEKWANENGPLENGLGYKLMDIVKKSAGIEY